MIEAIQKFFEAQILTANFLQGIIVELLGGMLFILLLLFILRPTFSISPIIVKYPDRLTGRTKYSVKVINKSIFSAIDIEVHLSYYILVPATGTTARTSPHKDNKTLNLIKNVYTYVPNRFHKDNEFALWFSTYDVLEDYLNPPTPTGQQPTTNTILVRVIMRHSLTGLTMAKEQEYTAIGQIKDRCYFKSGHSFDTVTI